MWQRRWILPESPSEKMDMEYSGSDVPVSPSPIKEMICVSPTDTALPEVNIITPGNVNQALIPEPISPLPLEEETLQINNSIHVSEEKSNKYKKPARPCLFCKLPQSRLKHHLLTKHKDEPKIQPLLTMSSMEQDAYIASLRKEAIKCFNVEMLNEGERGFMRERCASSKSEQHDTAAVVMCSGCKGFFANKYKTRHVLICPVAGNNFVLPMVNIASFHQIEQLPNDFKELLNSLYSDEIGEYIKTDNIILMFGARSYSALKRKKDKVFETRKYVRGRMRLVARLYLAFREVYSKQEEVCLTDRLNNAADMYRRDAISILAKAVNNLSGNAAHENSSVNSMCDQKSGLKVSILNLLKLTSNFLNGHFLMKNLDARGKQVTDFLVVLTLCQDEIFGDAYYAINYRKNINLKKPLSLPNDDDVTRLMDECNKVMSSIDKFDHPANCFVDVRSAAATSLIIFNARRGGEPVRLHLYQWQEALRGDWVEKDDLPEVFDNTSMYITYQTGKGADHLVPVIFPPQTFQAMQFLTSEEIRRDAGVHGENIYVFASTQNSRGHADGWHLMDDMLKRINLKGVINSTSNRHRVASLLAKLQLPEFERQLIYKHFGHSERINQTIYQAVPGSLQLNKTGNHLMQINTLQGGANPKMENTVKWQEKISKRKSPRSMNEHQGKNYNFTTII